MADSNKITKIYDLSLLGADDVLKKMDAVNKSFDEAKKNFTSYKSAVKSGQTETSASFQKAKEDLLKVQIAQKNLRAETVAYQNVLNQQKLANKQVADSNKQVAGSYNDLAARARALRAELKGNLVLEGVDPKKVAAGTAELKKLTSQMQNFDRSLTKNGTLVGEYTSGINKAFSAIGRNLLQFAAGFVGFQAIIQSITTLKSLSDSTSDLQINLDLSAEAVGNLTDQLKGLDTRTKLVELENIANIAAKAGVSPANLVGVTAALDKIKIAFGKDFGDVEQGTETLVKLINIFEGKENVTEQNLLKVGNAIRVLANESVASVPFLNEFSQRMAGLEGIFTNLKISQVLGLASGFEQFGQSSEVSSTALVKILPKLGQNVEKFAAIIGITSKQFTELLNNNPAEAVIQLAEALTKGKGNVVDVVTALGETDIGASRVTTTLGVLGKQADVFRTAIDHAGTAIQSTSNITDSFNVKNENLAGTIEHISKQFSDAADNDKFKALISALSNGVLAFIKVLGLIPFGVIISGLALVTTGWLWMKGAVISETLAKQVNNKTGLVGITIRLAEWIGIKNVTTAKVVDTLATDVNTAALEAQILASEAATVATKGFTTALKTNPFGLILVGLSFLVTAIAAFGSAEESATEKIIRQNKALKDQADALALNQQHAEKMAQSNKDLSESDPNRRLGRAPDFSKLVIGGPKAGPLSVLESLKASGVGTNTLQTPAQKKEQAEAAFGINIPALKTALEGYNNQIDEFKGSQSELDKIIALRNEAQKKLNDALQKDAAKNAKKAKKTAEELAKDKADAFLKEGLQAQKDAEDKRKWTESFEIHQVTEYQNVRDARITQLKIDQSKERALILGDLTLTDSKRKKKLEELAKAQSRTLLTEELVQIQDEVAAKKIAFDQGIIDYKTYLEALARLQAKAEELQANLTSSKVQLRVPGRQNNESWTKEKINENFNIEENAQDLLGNVIADSFNTAQFAMNSYFDSEAARVDQSKKHALSKLDEEEKNALKRATSKAQEEQIQKQFDKKRENIEREAFEKHKKLKRSEATIAYATELANIAVAAAGNPSNAETYGLSGLAMYAVLAGLATLRYGLNIGSINSQEYGEGGLPVKGGRFSGRSHAQGGIPANVASFEGDELAIINKRSARSNQTYSVRGTPSQIASSINTVGGGVNFSPGASMFSYGDGGYLGSSLQPPVLQAYYQNSTNDMSEVKGMIKDLATLVYSESVKPVVLSERNFTGAQNENRRRREVGQI